MIISRTPFRISFFGGGADYPAWYRKYGAKVIGVTIDKYCYISCRYLPPFFEHTHRIVYSKVEMVKSVDEISHPSVKATLKELGIREGVEIHHDGDLPARSGLGSSSAFTVGLIHTLTALKGQMISKEELAMKAVHIEREVLQENVGSQDQVLTAIGGFNQIEFRRDDSFNVTPVILDKEKITVFQNNLMLFFTGFTRIASQIAKHSIENLETRKTEIMAMQVTVDEALAEIQAKQFRPEKLGELMDRSWRYKRSLAKEISTPEIDQIYEAAKSAGACGGKLLGAGGGGFMLLIVRPEDQKKVLEKLKKLTHVDFRFDFTGSKIVVYEPNSFQ